MTLNRLNRHIVGGRAASRGVVAAASLGVVAAALAASLGVAAVATASAAGGLSLSPAVLEREAQRGPVGSIRVANDSTRPVSIVVRARPWIQGRDGTVRADGSRRLPQLRLDAARFTLQPGASRTVSATLTGRPRSGSLYGAIEVVGTPQGQRPRNGIVTRYRLLGALRLNPSRNDRRLRVQAGRARATARSVVLAVRNLGNTAAPVTGTWRITGATGTLRGAVASQRILPGATVDLRLHRGRLQPGRYTAAVTLRQGGRRVATVTRGFRVR